MLSKLNAWFKSKFNSCEVQNYTEAHRYAQRLHMDFVESIVGYIREVALSEADFGFIEIVKQTDGRYEIIYYNRESAKKLHEVLALNSIRENLRQ